MDLKRKVLIADLGNGYIYDGVSAEYLKEVLSTTKDKINYKEEQRKNGTYTFTVDLSKIVNDSPSFCGNQPDQKLTFQQAAGPLMKYLAENHHPHVTAIVSASYAELMEGLKSHSTDEFLKD